MISDEQLNLIEFKVTRGCHFENAFLASSLYVTEVIHNDIPAMLAEIRRLYAVLHKIAYETKQSEAQGLAWQAINNNYNPLQKFIFPAKCFDCDDELLGQLHCQHCLDVDNERP